MYVHLLPSDKDNYIYVLRDAKQNATIVIDPTESESVLNLCAQNDWTVNGILITHHHPDHIRGVAKISARYNAPVWGFGADSHRLPPLDHALKNSDSFAIKNIRFEAQHTPGHTMGHVSYFLPDYNYLFCGDTLFSMGCGRFFEGSAEMMLKNFQWMRTLPLKTSVYCSHEYTQVNTEFALNIDPNNLALQQFYNRVLEKRKNNSPTVPFSLTEQMELNPMLRWDDKTLRSLLNMETASDVDVLAQVRTLRDHWPR